MIAQMKMGAKGQVVVPKMFRDNYGLVPGGNVVFEEDGERIVIKKPASNIVEIAELIAKSGKKVKVTSELLKRLDDEEYEEKYERIRKQRLSGQ